MSKELIVSVNGREKKIAIIENGKVSEFYIERGESSQGIVGNIYKGRVMRVLPGMQSAFVDIGLERDAFLYVSDFFDEEDEFEQIVIDKSKTEGAEAARAAAAERLEQERIQRDRAIEAAHERAEPIPPALLAEAAAEVPATDVTLEQESTTAEAIRFDAGPAGDDARRGRRGRRRGRSDQPGPQALEIGPSAASRSGSVPGLGGEEGIATPFAAAADAFQRVVDEDELAAEEGSMFKDARLQERLFDQIHAVEFDLAATTAADVGSLLPATQSEASGFERVDDGETASAESGREHRPAQEFIAASVAPLVDAGEGTAGFGRDIDALSFERVSDAEEEIASTPAAGAPRRPTG